MTSIICTISPHIDHLSLSISTLEFAKRAKNINNKARVNELIDDHDIVQNRLKLLERQIHNLERSIEEANIFNEELNSKNLKLKTQIKELIIKNEQNNLKSNSILDGNEICTPVTSESTPEKLVQESEGEAQLIEVRYSYENSSDNSASITVEKQNPIEILMLKSEIDELNDKIISLNRIIISEKK